MTGRSEGAQKTENRKTQKGTENRRLEELDARVSAAQSRVPGKSTLFF